MINSEKHSQSLSDKKIYYSRYRPIWLFIAAMWLVVIPCWLLLIYMSPDSPWGALRYVIVLFHLLQAGLFVYLAFSQRLTLSANRVIYDEFAYCIATEWANVGSLADTSPSSPGVPGRYLLLRQPRLHVRTGGNWLVKLRGVRGDSIPLNLFINEQDKMLEQFIQQYAPHLLTKELTRQNLDG